MLLIEQIQKLKAFLTLGQSVLFNKLFSSQEMLVILLGHSVELQLQFLASNFLFLNHLLAESQFIFHLGLLLPLLFQSLSV
jgi:hypothetical protein